MDADQDTVWSADHASIDPTFNAIRPRGVSLQRDLPKLSGLGPWPTSMIAPFMHEVAHHWCLRGTLGNVLALMNLRSCETAIFGSQDGVEIGKALNDHWTFRAVLEFLRPLCEGIALFAEFDTWPGPSRVVSDPQQFAWLACARASVESERQLNALTRPVLRRIRRSRDGIIRKSNVLTHPIGEVGLAYLIGYLMLKGMYRFMSEILTEAEDPDWFLCYVRDFIFSDPGLVVALLAPPPAGLTVLEVFIRRVFARLGQQLPLVTSADAKRYTDFADRPEERLAGTRQRPEGLMIDAVDANAAERLVDELVAWLGAAPIDTERGAWRNTIVRLLERRGIALVAAEKIPMNVTSGFAEAVFVGEGGKLGYNRMGVLDPSEPDRTVTGWAAVMMRLGRRPVIAYALGDDVKVLAIRTRPDDALEDEPDLRRILLDPLGIPPVLGSLISDCGKALNIFSDFGMKTIGAGERDAEFERRQARRLANYFIDMLSEDWKRPGDWDSLPDYPCGRPSEIFSQDGIWPLFSPKASVLSAYIEGSAAGPTLATISPQVEAHVREIEHRFHIRLIRREGAWARFLI